jgi:ribosomal protein L11 methylase PrmA
MTTGTQLAASFRDPSGFVFQRGGRLFRQVNQAYREDYDHLMASGLYAALASDGDLVVHEEVALEPQEETQAYKILRPRRVPFVSYPYEWTFSQLQAAALLTLAIQKRALGFGMTLKDASAYNVQFLGTRPVLVDTLSFERYVEGEPWVAYRQFCQHFLAPLALMSLKDVRLGQLLRNHIDGIPLDLGWSLVPFSCRCRLSLVLHLYLHARMQKSYGTRSEKPQHRPFGRRSLLALIDSLESAVAGLTWQPSRTEWTDYYDNNTYTSAALEQKKDMVARFLRQVEPRSVWDFGANTGLFSRLAADQGITTVAFDSDPACVEQNYRASARRGDPNLLPLVLDLTNPSPGIGWGNRERMALVERGPADTVLALGLVHHLAIAGNVPLDAIAHFLASVGRSLIIEFIPKDDPQVGRLLVSRKDIFAAYNQEQFENRFSASFVLCERHPLEGSDRTLYLMRMKDPR